MHLNYIVSYNHRHASTSDYIEINILIVHNMTMVVVHHSNGNSYCICIHVSMTPHSPAHHLACMVRPLLAQGIIASIVAIIYMARPLLTQGIIASIVTIIYSLSGYIDHCDISDHITLC